MRLGIEFVVSCSHEPPGMTIHVLLESLQKKGRERLARNH